jgi:hypothetical protein
MIFLILTQALANHFNEIPKLTSSASCPAYSCAPSSVKKPFTNTCISESSSSQYYLWECPTDSTANYCNTTSGTCEVQTLDKSLSYVGEPCTATSDCYMSSCLNSVCTGSGLNSSCSAHEQCGLGLRCSSSNYTCQPQIPVGGSGCNTYLDCVNWATCNLTYSSDKGVCIEYYSQNIGTVVTDCVGGYSYMCGTAYCNKKYFFGYTGVCAASPVSYGASPKVCKSDKDCVGHVGGNNVTSDCICGYNSNGNSYCTPFIGDLQGVVMLNSWNKALKKTAGCNTVRRSSDACMQMVGSFVNVTQSTLGFYNYPLYQGNDECVMIIYNNDYYLESGSYIQAFLLVFLVLSLV